MKIASTNWEGPEHLLFAYKISVFNFQMYQLWEQILFASPEIGEKNENINPMQSYTDRVESLWAEAEMYLLFTLWQMC